MNVKVKSFLFAGITAMLLTNCKVDDVRSKQDVALKNPQEGEFLEKIEDVPSKVYYKGRLIESQAEIDKLVSQAAVIEHKDKDVIILHDQDPSSVARPKSNDGYLNMDAKTTNVHPSQHHHFVYFDFSLRYRISNGHIFGIHFGRRGSVPQWFGAPMNRAHILNWTTQERANGTGLIDISFNSLSRGKPSHTLVVRVVNTTPDLKWISIFTSGNQRILTLLRPNQMWSVHSDGQQTWANGTARFNGHITGHLVENV